MLRTQPDATTSAAPRRRRSTSTDLALIASFAALIGVLGLVPPVAIGLPVPITLQTMGVMIAGLVLGPRRAVLAVLVFLALVAVGIPLLSGGRGGLAAFVAPTSGYLLGFVLGAFVTGWLRDRLLPRLPIALAYIAAAIVGGVLAIYLIGIPVMVWRTGVSPMAGLVFLPGDIVKAILATLVAVGVAKALPDR
ncbi:MAG: biotin transporter BioY [Actinomycetia bacterium]|nr:biotin transporter BioY [Actinomycetes bacterium]